MVGVSGEGPSASPRNLLTSTLGDELKLATQGKSRVFTTAMKDRSAVFSAGFTADGVYWTDPASGSWVTSTFYADKLPEWVTEVGALVHPEHYDKVMGYIEIGKGEARISAESFSGDVTIRTTTSSVTPTVNRP